MKISLEWLSDFVDLSEISPDTIADRLTMATAEVEGFETVHRCLAGIRIAEVLAVEPITSETGDVSPFVLAKVDTGEQTVMTVCGASNVRPGLKAPFAAPGCKLAGGKEISVTEVFGKKSEGVLCSARELGFSAFHEGLLECPSSLKTGTLLSAYVNDRDVLFEIDNKSLTNRPDLWGHYGFARELAAILGKPLRELAQVDLSRFDELPGFPVTVEDLDLCPCYSCIEFDVNALEPSPLFLQARLHALGQRSFGLMIDLTNYVMMEIGQPTHAFDAEMVKAIRVAKAGETIDFQTLDKTSRGLRPNDLMIWNEARPVALAGIMGGFESEVRASTSRVLLESANFKGSQVRRTSTELGLRTEASQRFEKNQPPVNTRTAVRRILQLLEENQIKYKPTSRFSYVGQLDGSYRVMEMPVSAVTRAAGFPIEHERIEFILSSLGFQVEVAAGESLQVGVPPFRSRQDISIVPDIVEEILRIYGYDNVPTELPTVQVKPLYIDNLLRREHKAQRTLAIGHGFTEVHTYIWMDDFWLEKIGFQPSRTLIVKNPSAEGKRQLRTTLIPNLLALVDQNRGQSQRLKLFEVGHVFAAVDDEAGCEETTHLAGVTFVNSTEDDLDKHYLSVKGAVEDVASMLGCSELTFNKAESNGEPWKAEGKWVRVELNNETVGEMGVLSRSLEMFGGQVVWFELNLNRMSGPIYTEVSYQAPPIYPLSWQDFTLAWSLEKGYEDLRKVLNQFEHPLIKRLDFQGVYSQSASELGNYTFRYWLGADDRTLTGEEIEQFHAELLAYLHHNEIPLS